MKARGRKPTPLPAAERSAAMPSIRSPCLCGDSELHGTRWRVSGAVVSLSIRSGGDAPSSTAANCSGFCARVGGERDQGSNDPWTRPQTVRIPWRQYPGQYPPEVRSNDCNGDDRRRHGQQAGGLEFLPRAGSPCPYSPRLADNRRWSTCLWPGTPIATGRHGQRFRPSGRKLD